MNFAQAIVLGVVQGLTEFLPVSSSGHLVIASKMLGIPQNIPYDVMLHFATLAAVCVYFAKDISSIIRAFLFKRTMKDPDFRTGVMVIIASIPTAIIGFSLSDKFESLFSSLYYVGIFLILTSLILLLAQAYGKRKKDIKKLSITDSLIIGIAQGCAIAPGLSRSGTTVSASLLRGINPALSARFSFLLSIPAILGASIFKASSISAQLNFESLAGSVVAALSGYFAICVFVKMIEQRKLSAFAYYCFLAGILSIIFSCP